MLLCLKRQSLCVTQCLKYYTDQQSDVRRVEQLNSLFFRLMAAGPDAPGAQLLSATSIQSLQMMVADVRWSHAQSDDPAPRALLCNGHFASTPVSSLAYRRHLHPVYRVGYLEQGIDPEPATSRVFHLNLVQVMLTVRALCSTAEDAEMAPAASDAQQPQAQQAHNHQQQRPAQQRQRHQQQGGKGGGGGKKRRG